MLLLVRVYDLLSDHHGHVSRRGLGFRRWLEASTTPEVEEHCRNEDDRDRDHHRASSQDWRFRLDHRTLRVLDLRGTLHHTANRIEVVRTTQLFWGIGHAPCLLRGREAGRDGPHTLRYMESLSAPTDFRVQGVWHARLGPPADLRLVPGGDSQDPPTCGEHVEFAVRVLPQRGHASRRRDVEFARVPSGPVR